ncbi:hypothetical protein [uncultured Tateyamaria sp.]|uniref:hypothetical protein n=1 Tax=uncultured Tateyamaria sp. TaxID=455651 RepID=UPI002638B611|nr:hypothetical protein [uncultured Tateyamaria sp.]
MPFGFSGNAATDELFDGDFGTAFAADIDAARGDVVMLGGPDAGGFFAVTNFKRLIADLVDFDGIRVPPSTLPPKTA